VNAHGGGEPGGNIERLAHLASLDGLRGIAVLSVLLFHFGRPLESSVIPVEHWVSSVISHGMRGVDLFFALSGFLITRILVESRGASNYFSAFYVRRALRIFPVYFCFLFTVFAVAKVHVGLWPYLLFVSNFTHGGGVSDPYLSHLWSLAVEEQFYLVWPIVILLCPPRRLLGFAVLLAALVPALRFLVVGNVSVNMLLRLTPFRADALILGGIVSLVVANPKYFPLVKLWSVPAMIAGFLAWALTRQSNAQFSVGYSGTALTCAGILAWAVSFSPAVLKLRWLRSIGKHSYAMYIYHLIIGHYVLISMPNPWQTSTAGHLSFIVASVACSYGVAWLSFQILESPFLWLKRNFEPRHGSGMCAEQTPAGIGRTTGGELEASPAANAAPAPAG
jgi:peptidoglycan/LPS O-acetylase OafA/YrhL